MAPGSPETEQAADPTATSAKVTVEDSAPEDGKDGAQEGGKVLGKVASRPVGLSPKVQDRVEEVIAGIRQQNGLDVSVLVGDLQVDDIDGFKAGAQRLHAALGSRSATAVLLVVAPGQRRVEVVTGGAIRRRVPDRVCALAVLSMTTAFAGGDLGAGIIDGLRQIADSAGRGPALPAPGTTGAMMVSTAHGDPHPTPALGEPQIQPDHERLEH